MRITVVTPVFQGMPFLPACIASVDAQRADFAAPDETIEHLVYDAGSSDGSREWLSSHAAARAATLVFEKDRGQVDALEKGFARARGDVLCWLNSDDTFEPHALRRALDAFARRPDAVAVSGSCLTMNVRGVPLEVIVPPPKGDLQTILRHTDNLSQPSTFFTKEAFAAVGGFDASLDLAFDNDLFRKLARYGHIETLPLEIFARFRIHKDSKTERNHALSARQDLRSRRRMGLPLTAPTTLTLVKRGYVYPLVPPVAMRAAKRIVGALHG